MLDPALVAKAAEIGDRVTGRQARITAEQARLVDDIAELISTGAWAADGAGDAIGWLMAKLNVPYPQAADLVSLARRLQELPVLAKSFAEGNIPIEAAGAAAKLASPETDQFFTEVAETSQAKDLMQAVKRKESLENQKLGPPPRPMLHWSASKDGWYRFSGFLAPDQGARLVTALKRVKVRGEGPDPETGEWAPAETRAAEALLEVAETALCRCKDADRARTTVNVHVDIRDLVTGEGSGELASGGVITAEGVRKLACDGKVRWMFRDERGLLGIGMSDRGIPEPMATYLRNRDGGCRFGGCSRTRYLDAHHIVHWANGGPTNVSNLIMLCHQHHSLIHEGGWHIEGSPEPGPGVDDTLRFVRPDGAVFVPHPMVAAWRSSLRGSASEPPSGEAPTPTGGPPWDDDSPSEVGRRLPESLF